MSTHVVTSPSTRSVCHALHSGSVEVTWPLAYPNTGSANRRYDGVSFASTRGNSPAPAACPPRSFASGCGAGVGSGSVGRVTRNSST